MRFDDRLKTVLAQPAATAHDRAVRWRQLVELIARSPPAVDDTLTGAALDEVRDRRGEVHEHVRSATALAVARLALPVDLVAVFAADKLGVAAPVLASARLTASEWRTVAAAPTADCRAFIAAMRSDQPEHPPRSAAAAESPSQPGPPEGAIPSISDVVARIERLRQSREADPADAGGADLAETRLFRWECNESGEIEWVEGAPRGAVIGATLAQAGAYPGVDRAVQRAFQSRAPFHDGVLELPSDSAIGGKWTISGVPAFERSSGRFAGYRGVAARPSGDAIPQATERSGQDSLRELAHEIKTPLNAIIGFAEIISGEYLGPAGDRFRERAGDIVAQARLLLSAIEDLDFAAKIHSSPNGKSSTDIGALVERLAGAIRDVASARGVEIEASRSTSGLTAAVESDIVERLILRMCSAVIARAAQGERLQLRADQGPNYCTVSISRPQSLEGLSEEELFGASNDAMSPGFPLRLARGLAQTAGAGLIASERGITLLFRRD